MTSEGTGYLQTTAAVNLRLLVRMWFPGQFSIIYTQNKELIESQEEKQQKHTKGATLTVTSLHEMPASWKISLPKEVCCKDPRDERK